MAKNKFDKISGLTSESDLSQLTEFQLREILRIFGYTDIYSDVQTRSFSGYEFSNFEDFLSKIEALKIEFSEHDPILSTLSLEGGGSYSSPTLEFTFIRRCTLDEYRAKVKGFLVEKEEKERVAKEKAALDKAERKRLFLKLKKEFESE